MANMNSGVLETDDLTPTHGFPLRILCSRVDPKYLCSHCRKILRRPTQARCGHRFCKICIEYLIKSVPAPFCRPCAEERDQSQLEDDSEPLNEHFPDNAISKELNRCSALCIYDGCDWMGVFKDAEAHLCICLFRLVPCTECQQLIPQNQLTEHSESEHVTDKLCRFQCGEIVSKEISESEHMRTHIVQHMSVLFNKVQHIETLVGLKKPSSSDTLTSTLSVQVPRIESIEETVKQFEVRLNELQLKIFPTIRSSNGAAENCASGSSIFSGATAVENALPTLRTSSNNKTNDLPENVSNTLLDIVEKLTIFENVLTVLNREGERLFAEVESVGNGLKASSKCADDLERKIKQMERQLALKDSTIAELELKVTSLELTSYDGTIIWKISDFKKRRQEAISGRTPFIYSTAFFTSRAGYKMCARIYLNGDGMGKGTHVSLFFVIMRGPYDAILSWPFSHKVNLIFLDQNNREHVYDAFRPDPTSTSFRRPVSEMNIASGCPLFLALTQLDNPANGYIKDDTAFLKIIVNANASA